MAAESGAEVRHGAPRCLLGLFDATAGGFAGWSEFDAEAERLSTEVCGLSREELRVLIESSTLEIPTTEHRRLHQEASDFVWWDGGRRTLALYSWPYFSLLAGLRWGRVVVEALIEHRVESPKGEGRSDPLPRVYSWCPRTQVGKEAGGRGDHWAAARTERLTARALRG